MKLLQMILVVILVSLVVGAAHITLNGKDGGEGALFWLVPFGAFGILWLLEGVSLLKTERSPNDAHITKEDRPFRFWIEVICTFGLALFCLACFAFPLAICLWQAATH